VRRLTAVAASGTAALVAMHWPDVHRAAHAIPAWAFVAVAIHVATLAGRSEAWRLVLAAVTGDPLPRVAVHGANAAAFGAGIVQSQAALAVRVALLSRVERRAIRRADVAHDDVPIVAGTLATLGASGAAGVGPALVLGIVVSATSICGVGVYAIATGAAVLAERTQARRPLTSRA